VPYLHAHRFLHPFDWLARGQRSSPKRSWGLINLATRLTGSERMSQLDVHRLIKTDTGESVHAVAKRLVTPKHPWLIDPRSSNIIGYWDLVTTVSASSRLNRALILTPCMSFFSLYFDSLHSASLCCTAGFALYRYRVAI
jgi:hypothetical protein